MPLLLSHSGPSDERTEISLNEASEARLKEILGSGQITHHDFTRVLNLMARRPELGQHLAEKSGCSDPLLAVLQVILDIRRVEADRAVQKLAAVFLDQETLSAADAFLEAKAGNFVPLRDRLRARRATTTFDRAALAGIFTSGQRSIDAALPQLLPRNNRERAVLLGLAFGLAPLSPAALSRALAPQRQPKTRAGSWKTVHGRWKVAGEYSRLRRTMGKTAALEKVAGAGLYRIRPGEKAIEAAVTATRKRYGARRSKAEIYAAMKIYLEYRRLANPHSS